MLLEHSLAITIRKIQTEKNQNEKYVWASVFPLHCALPGQVLPSVSLSDLVLSKACWVAVLFYYVFNQVFQYLSISNTLKHINLGVYTLLFRCFHISSNATINLHHHHLVTTFLKRVLQNREISSGNKDSQRLWGTPKWTKNLQGTERKTEGEYSRTIRP